MQGVNWRGVVAGSVAQQAGSGRADQSTAMAVMALIRLMFGLIAYLFNIFHLIQRIRCR